MKLNSVICGDAVSEMQKIADESVDLIVADPPYNLGKDYGNNHDLRGFDEYLDFTHSWLTEAKRILKNDGTIFAFMGVRFISYLYQIMDRDLKLFFNSWICWHYTQGIGKTRGFSPRHDSILMFTKSKKFNFYLDNVRIPQKFYRSRNNMRGANPGDVWEFSHVHYCNENRQNHPTQKPEGLVERMILGSSKEGDTVVDPFAGSGTTLRVCQQLKRHSIGIELNEAYVQMINARLAEPFSGFDSVDSRMSRIPNDMNNEELRNQYLANHRAWFLGNHPDALEEFLKNARVKYGHSPDDLARLAGEDPLLQKSLFGGKGD